VFLRSMEDLREDDNNETLSFQDFLEEIALKKRISTLDDNDTQEAENLPISKIRQFTKLPPSDPKTHVPPDQKSYVERRPTPYTPYALLDPKTHVSPDSKGSIRFAAIDPKSHVPQCQKDRNFHRVQTQRSLKTDPLLEGVMNQKMRVSKDDTYVPSRLQPGQLYAPRAYSNSNAVVRYDGRSRDKTREFFTFEPASAHSAPAITGNLLDGSKPRESGVNSWPSMKLSRGDVEWMQDNETKVCLNMACGFKFSVTWRRHHCRYCGKIYCGNCCPIEKLQGFRICVLCSKHYMTYGEGGGKSLKPPKN